MFDKIIIIPECDCLYTGLTNVGVFFCRSSLYNTVLSAHEKICVIFYTVYRYDCTYLLTRHKL